MSDEKNWQAIAEERERQLRAQGELLRAAKEELAAAAQVCVLFGWTAAIGDASEKRKAVEQAWHDWADAYGPVSPNPEWRRRIKELSRRRDEIRARTLAGIRAEPRSGDTSKIGGSE